MNEEIIDFNETCETKYTCKHCEKDFFKEENWKKHEERCLESQRDKEEIRKIKEDENKIFDVFSTRGQIESFYQKQPFYYDSSKIFWLWNENLKKWEISDEVDYLNSIQDCIGIDTINSKKRTELIEGFKQIGRKNKPENFQKTWIQFKDTIVNIQTDEKFKSSHKYFGKNPLPYNLGESEETPNINNLFEQWVGKEHSIKLIELCAYSMCSDQFMQRIFALCGGGSNGKGTFVKFLKKLIGIENSVSSELKSLSEDKFEPAVLFGKLLCIMGEVSQDDLRNTNMIKKIAGEDDLSFQFKGKTPFTDFNTATAICLTNSLPVTPDKTFGFYRKWQIIDFPNQFSGVKRDLISEIPEKEFENFMLKCFNTLKRLYKTNEFTDEGSFQQRMERYEERSNPLMKFIESECEEDFEEYISIKIFGQQLNEYLKQKHLRVYTPKEIKKTLMEEGFDVRKGTKDYINGIFIYGLKLKNIPNMPNMPKNEIDFSYRKSVEKNGINGINGIKQEILNYFKENQEKLVSFNDLYAINSNQDELYYILEELSREGLIFSPINKFWRYLG